MELPKLVATRKPSTAPGRFSPSSVIFCFWITNCNMKNSLVVEPKAFEKYARQIGSFPQVGVKIKKNVKLPAREG